MGLLMLYTCLVSNGQNAEIGQIYDTILSYMLSYMTPPSFMSAVSTTAPQEELPYDGSTYSLTLTDTNNVIGNYSFSASDTAVSVEVSGSQLILRSASPLSAPVSVVATRNSAYTAASTFTPYGSTTRQDIVVGVEAVGGMTGYLTLKANHKEFRIKNMPQKHLEHCLLTASAKVDSNTVTMDADGELANAIVPLTVVNTRGFNLPQTGGHRTWMYGVAGTVLMVAAAIILVSARRKKKLEK